MGRYLKIHHTPNQNGMPQFTVIRDDGDLREPEKRTVHTDPINIIKDVAAFLADCEGGR